MYLLTYSPSENSNQHSQSDQRPVGAIWIASVSSGAERTLIRRHECADITKTRLFKYTENFTTKKNENFQIKKLWYVSYFCSKYRLWVLVRIASSSLFFCTQGFFGAGQSDLGVCYAHISEGTLSHISANSCFDLNRIKLAAVWLV